MEKISLPAKLGSLISLADRVCLYAVDTSKYALGFQMAKFGGIKKHFMTEKDLSFNVLKNFRLDW